MLKIWRKHKTIYDWGNQFLNHPTHLKTHSISNAEIAKTPLRSDIINFILSTKKNETNYLEIGVRFPKDNFDLIKADNKYSVDPGVEYKENPVDFKITSDEFFDQLNRGDILNKDIKFDVIFIDGLHLADQVERDIKNSLEWIKEDGFIVLHDCNPPSEYHARDDYSYDFSPAKYYWNGTTWKAFVKARQDKSLNSCCIDTDWGVGILCKHINLGESKEVNNDYFEYYILDQNRVDSLNLIDFDKFKTLIV